MRNGGACWVTLVGKKSPAATRASMLAWKTASLTIIIGAVASTHWTIQAALTEPGGPRRPQAGPGRHAKGQRGGDHEQREERQARHAGPSRPKGDAMQPCAE